MKCPVCPDSTLNMTNRENIEIDYCPQCRGVWLDRGELDKIIERSTNERPTEPPAAAAPPDPRYSDPRYDPRYPDRRYDDDHYKYQHRKRRGLLGDLFDFD